MDSEREQTVATRTSQCSRRRHGQWTAGPSSLIKGSIAPCTTYTPSSGMEEQKQAQPSNASCCILLLSHAGTLPRVLPRAWKAGQKSLAVALCTLHRADTLVGQEATRPGSPLAQPLDYPISITNHDSRFRLSVSMVIPMPRGTLKLSF